MSLTSHLPLTHKKRGYPFSHFCRRRKNKIMKKEQNSGGSGRTLTDRGIEGLL